MSTSAKLVWAVGRVFLVGGAEGQPRLWSLRPGAPRWTDTGPLPFRRPLLSPTMINTPAFLLVGGATCDGTFSEEQGCKGNSRFELARYDLKAGRWSVPRTVAKKRVASVRLLGYARGEAELVTVARGGLVGSVVHVDITTGRVVSDEAGSSGSNACDVGAGISRRRRPRGTRP